MLKHEQGAKEIYGEASDFEAVVTKLGRKVIGWTFHVPRDPEDSYSHDGFSWIDLDGDVTSDTYGTRFHAAVVMKQHLKAKRQTPVDVLEKRT